MTADDDLLLPAGTRLLHIGLHKTGSSALQAAFRARREDLRRYGVAYPGSGTRPRKPGWALGLTGRRAGTPRPSIEVWERFSAEVEAAGDARVVVSNEDFGKATRSQVEQIVGDLGGDRAHVVMVVRRFDTFLPSQWQERAKAGNPYAWEEWLRRVLDRDGVEQDFERTNVWRAHGIERSVPRWVKVVGADRFTLVIGDERDPMRLFRVFERLVGLPVETLRPVAERSNRSLGWGELELVRALHRGFAERGVPRRARDPWIARGVLPLLRGSDLPRLGPKAPPFPDWALERLRVLGDERATAVREMGVRVLGDPDDLRVPPDLEPGPVDDSPPVPQQTLDAVLDVLVGATVEHVPGLAGQSADAADPDPDPDAGDDEA